MRTAVLAMLVACRGTFAGPSDHPPEEPAVPIAAATLDVHVAALRKPPLSHTGLLPRDLSTPADPKWTLEATPAVRGAMVSVTMLTYAGHGCFTQTLLKDASYAMELWIMPVDSLDALDHRAAWPPPRGSIALVHRDTEVCAPNLAITPKTRYLVVVAHVEGHDALYSEGDALDPAVYKAMLAIEHDALFAWQLQ